MTTHQVPGAGRVSTPTPAPPPAWRSFAEWLVAILGAVAIFMGAFILLAGDDQWVGFWGDATWQVGDISAWWGIGLLVGGILAITMVAASVWQRRH